VGALADGAGWGIDIEVTEGALLGDSSSVCAGPALDAQLPASGSLLTISVPAILPWPPLRVAHRHAQDRPGLYPPSAR